MYSLPPKGWFAGVGSRETPDEILALMRQVSQALYAAGYGLSSGDAEGADTAFYEGALASRQFQTNGARIYLAWDGVRGRAADPKNFFYDATKFPTWETARSMASEVHPAWEKCGRGGIAMHTRNVFQILGHMLNDPVKAIIYWAKPVGKTETVKGGTNMALQMSIRAGIPKRINLYTDEGLAKAHALVDLYGNPLKRAA
ncbi:hypothetical protein D3C71_471450 [compost metagenome]